MIRNTIWIFRFDFPGRQNPNFEFVTGWLSPMLSLSKSKVRASKGSKVVNFSQILEFAKSRKSSQTWFPEKSKLKGIFPETLKLFDRMDLLASALLKTFMNNNCFGAHYSFCS